MTNLADLKAGELRGSEELVILSQAYRCTLCGAEKPADQFGGWPRNKWCKDCARAYQRELRKRHGGDYRGTGRNKHHQAQSDVYRKLLRILQHRKSSAGGGNATAEHLEELWVRQQGKCALSGEPMNLTGGEDIVSLDQIVAGAGYNVGNVQLLRWCVNRAKGAMPTEDFLTMCRQVGRCNDYP